MGDPLDPATEVGPLVAGRQRDRVEGYLRSGQDEGAKVALGGGRPAGLDKGYYVEPTSSSDVDNKMRIAQEEIFGPVLAVIPYDGDDDAVAIANDSHYGLCGSVWTGDNDRGLGVARQVRTGTYMLNASVPMTSPPPSAGTRSRGLGGSSVQRGWSSSSRRSPSPCRAAIPQRSDHARRAGLPGTGPRPAYPVDELPPVGPVGGSVGKT